jgi:DNA replication and repair protein RecF
VIVSRIWLTDFRNYQTADLSLSRGCTVVIGANGQGKTNLVEALSFLATLQSFRNVTNDALVRTAADQAVVRAEVVHDDGREMLIEAEVPRRGRVKAQVNRQRLARTSDLLGAVRVSVFSPDDLVLVKGSPSERRQYLDDALVALVPANGTLLADIDRVLRQRAALLKQAGGRLTGDIELTLDVWDDKLAGLGSRLGQARCELVAELEPHVAQAYGSLAGRTVDLRLMYTPEWMNGEGLGAALKAARTDDVRRQVNSVGPHRDDLDVLLSDLPARTHASQGEQRTMALALKLAAHRLVTERHGEAPVLVLDDVLSELDESRATALLGNLPPGQILITTASAIPAAARPDRVLTVTSGVISSPA